MEVIRFGSVSASGHLWAVMFMEMNESMDVSKGELW